MFQRRPPKEERNKRMYIPAARRPLPRAETTRCPTPQWRRTTPIWTRGPGTQNLRPAEWPRGWEPPSPWSEFETDKPWIRWKWDTCLVESGSKRRTRRWALLIETPKTRCWCSKQTKTCTLKTNERHRSYCKPILAQASGPYRRDGSSFLLAPVGLGRVQYIQHCR